MIKYLPSDAEVCARVPWLSQTFDVRSLIIPDPGYKFVLCDLAQIEPRVLAWLADSTKMLKAMAEGFGVYEAAAIGTGKYNGPKGGFKKLKALYQAQKAQTLALGYGCGWKKYIVAAMTLAGYDVCKNDLKHPVTGKVVYGSAARKEVSDWRIDNTEVLKLWADLDGGFKAQVGSDFVMELPSGRSMVYRNVQKRKKQKVHEIIDEETGLMLRTEIREGWDHTAELDGRRYSFYGGALTENAVQATARDVFGYHLLLLRDAFAKLDDPKVRVVFHSHDEAISQVPLDFDPLIIEKIMCIAPPWLPGCPLGAEAKEAAHYLK